MWPSGTHFFCPRNGLIEIGLWSMRSVQGKVEANRRLEREKGRMLATRRQLNIDTCPHGLKRRLPAFPRLDNSARAIASDSISRLSGKYRKICLVSLLFQLVDGSSAEARRFFPFSFRKQSLFGPSSAKIVKHIQARQTGSDCSKALALLDLSSVHGIGRQFEWNQKL
ncbi:unnamed protein product [Protopolystoma xenopodis]|uniref:Uncharacterized protein n=1 Tax=Protopolystoma xenopodis TaxID=117903 RepID=A0A448XFG5_9PLAT|nr:unnamed protein product [Protopolystoma xenopodis]